MMKFIPISNKRDIHDFMPFWLACIWCFQKMPRQARIDAPGGLHHTMVRGIEKKEIFRSDDDWKDFLCRLGDMVSETKTGCFALARSCPGASHRKR